MAPMVFPWEKGASPAPGPRLPIVLNPDLDVTGVGQQNVDNGVYSVIRPAAKKRKWLVIQCMLTSLAPVVISPSLGPVTVGKSGYILLNPGDAVIFSDTGDMPWKGPVYGMGLGAVGSTYWTEAQEWPIE